MAGTNQEWKNLKLSSVKIRQLCVDYPMEICRFFIWWNPFENLFNVVIIAPQWI